MNRSVKHWSTTVNQAVVQRGNNGSFNLCIEGGSEYGQFVVIGDVLTDKVLYKSGSLTPGEIILEINGTHIAGYTQTDGISIIKDSGNVLRITSVYPGLGISRDLRKYLGTRFGRGSLDHELQQTIRDNLYMRTVPCTTRNPREGEVPGVDYEFLSVNEYLELERSGRLLESGFYEGNYYGTPKPPKTPMTPGTGTIRKPKVKKAGADQQTIKSLGGRGSDDTLPQNWEVAYTKEGEMYFVDHNTGRTQWEDPRKMKSRSTSRLANSLPQQRDEDDLPPGWEKVDDPKYGTYYIDHVNRRTQYEKPEPLHKRRPSMGNKQPHDMKGGRRDSQPATAQPQQRRGLQIDPKNLKGETFRVSLRKGAKGFGFTIVGGEQPGEVLQVNNIVRGGTADQDGRLHKGDIIMRLNGRNVLNWSHGDIIRFLQGTRVGEPVELDLLRGYDLPFDPEDPEVKKVGTGGGSRGNLSSSRSNLQQDRNDGGIRRNNSQEYLSDGEGYGKQGGTRSGATTPIAFRSGAPQYTVVAVVRGPNGFGFTIADSPYGQRVKDIIDRNRCQGLQTGDVIIRINSTVVHNLDHAEVVEVLKQCPRGKPTNFQIQRSGVLTVVKSMPTTPSSGRGRTQQPQRPKSMPALDDEIMMQENMRNSTSMGVIARTNGEVSNGGGETYEERSHPQISESGDGYKSLKRAVQQHARQTDGDEVNSAANFKDYVITIKRGQGGFGFRIVGGKEEQTQVTIDIIVEGGAAQQDGRLREGDIILAVDGVNVVDASHEKVISLMQNAGINGTVTLRIRRKNAQSGAQQNGGGYRGKMVEHVRSDNESTHSDKHVEEWLEETHHNNARNMHPYRATQPVNARSKSETNLARPKSCPPPAAPKPQVKKSSSPQNLDVSDGHLNTKVVHLTRTQNEGFGFVIMSSPNSQGSVIGRIIPNSPSFRCGNLFVNDQLISVNDRPVDQLSHSEIVSMVKNSGLQVKLVLRKQSGDEDDEEDAAPPRPAGPSNYTPSYNRHTDDLKEQYSRHQNDREQETREEEPPARPRLTEPLGERSSSQQQTTQQGECDIRRGDRFSVVLRKGEKGFGFSIRGGEGLPLFVLRIAENSAAWNDGRIKVGDEILEINRANTEMMSHAQAVNAIRNCSQTCELIVRRPDKPLVSEEALKNRPRSEYNN